MTSMPETEPGPAEHARALSTVTWARSAGHHAWVAEAPGGEVLTVTQQAHRSWVPSVAGPDGQARWRGGPHSTRPAAQQAAEAEATADSAPLILDLFGTLLIEAAEQLMTATPGAADLADAGRIRGADWRDLLAQLSGLPRPLVGVLTAMQQPAEAVS
jgi:hypothetical protein